MTNYYLYFVSNKQWHCILFGTTSVIMERSRIDQFRCCINVLGQGTWRKWNAILLSKFNITCNNYVHCNILGCMMHIWQNKKRKPSFCATINRKYRKICKNQCVYAIFVRSWQPWIAISALPSDMISSCARVIKSTISW